MLCFHPCLLEERFEISCTCWKTHFRLFFPCQKLETLILHYPLKIVKVHQKLIEILVDRILIHRYCVAQAALIILKDFLVILLDELPDFLVFTFMLSSQGNTLAPSLVLKNIEQLLAIKAAAHKMSTGLRTLAHIFNETFQRLCILKEVMERKHTDRHIKSVFAATIALFHTLSIFFGLWFRTKNLISNLTLLLRTDCHSITNVASAIAIHKQRIGHITVFSPEIYIARTGSINFIFEIILRHIDSKNKGESRSTPLCQITGFTHRKINECVSLLRHIGDQSPLHH